MLLLQTWCRDVSWLKGSGLFHVSDLPQIARGKVKLGQVSGYTPVIKYYDNLPGLT